MKWNLFKQVEKNDAAKKVNPLDLSSDQDLTVALMNLILIEEKSTGELFDMVHEMRRNLMARIVKRPGVWCVSKHLLAQSMHMVNNGNKLINSNHDKAYEMYNRAYELYSLFWGINMGLVDMAEIKQSAPDVFEMAQIDKECK